MTDQPLHPRAAEILESVIGQAQSAILDETRRFRHADEDFVFVPRDLLVHWRDGLFEVLTRLSAPIPPQQGLQIDYTCGCSDPYFFDGEHVLSGCSLHRDGRPARLRPFATRPIPPREEQGETNGNRPTTGTARLSRDDGSDARQHGLHGAGSDCDSAGRAAREGSGAAARPSVESALSAEEDPQVTISHLRASLQQAQDENAQIAAILAMDMTTQPTNAPPPEPREPLTPLASSVYALVQETRRARSHAPPWCDNCASYHVGGCR